MYSPWRLKSITGDLSSDAYSDWVMSFFWEVEHESRRRHESDILKHASFPPELVLCFVFGMCLGLFYMVLYLIIVQ